VNAVDGRYRCGALRDAVRAEWTKARTSPATWPLLGALVVLTVAVGALAAGSVDGRPGTDAATTALTGVHLGLAVAAVLGAGALAGEHATGMLRSTFAAVPGRGTVLAAKAVVLVGLVLPAALLAVGGSLLAGRLLLPAAARPGLSLADGPVLRAAAGSAACVVLVALLALGTAAVVRDPGASVGCVLALLYLFPVAAALVDDPVWQRRLVRVGPASAGLGVRTTVPDAVRALPIGPWAGLAVAAGWAAGALLAGWWALRARDV
jgi:ABC-2 type transport system permease protein